MIPTGATALVKGPVPSIPRPSWIGGLIWPACVTLIDLLTGETPFPVDVEYYWAPMPRQEYWDEDFARLRASGFRIVRSFSFWNWMEPRPRQYELEDFDLLFDLAAKHGLSVWMDVALATHATCPEWLLREYPDIRSVDEILALDGPSDSGPILEYLS